MHEINPDGEMVLKDSLGRLDLEFIAKSREKGLRWRDIGYFLNRSGEATRSAWRRAVNRFDDLQDEDDYKRFIALSQRFWSKVKIVNNPTRIWEEGLIDYAYSCWDWTAGKNLDGYGKFRIGQTSIISSKMAYLLTKGNVPEGQVVMHLCHNKSCCNPSHLRLGTKSENGKHKKGKQ